MTDIIIQGIYGRMGRALLEKIGARDDCRVVAGVDREAGNVGSIPVYAGFAELPCKGVIIDFSSPAGAVAAAQYGAENGLPCVICSTGLSKEDEAVLEAASAKVPIFRSANMSVGVNVLIELARQATKILGGEFDIEIVEKHHHNKLDAPSGTAKMLFSAIQEVRPDAVAHCGRAGEGKREKNEIGISALRMGGIVGIHEVHICTQNQMLTLRHEAMDRGMLADGGVAAARFLAGRSAGLYNMENILEG